MLPVVFGYTRKTEANPRITNTSHRRRSRDHGLYQIVQLTRPIRPEELSAVPDAHGGLTVTARSLIPQTDSQLKRSRAVRCAYAELYCISIRNNLRIKAKRACIILRHVGALTCTKRYRAPQLPATEESSMADPLGFYPDAKEYAHGTVRLLAWTLIGHPANGFGPSFQQLRRQRQQAATASHR